jgi:photosystem II stability/assembly factor-like uncharacterized protein
MRKKILIVLTAFLALGISACQLGIATPPPPVAPPTLTAAATLPPPTAPPTLTPTITPTPPLNSPNGPPLIAIHMFSQQRGWGVIENQLLSTTDGGVSWAGVPVPGGTFSGYNGAFFLDEKSAFILVPAPGGASGLLNFTADGGQTWESIPVPAAQGQVQFMPNTNLEGFIFQDLGITMDSMPVALYQTLDRVNWLRTFAHDVPGQPVNGLPLTGIKNGVAFISNSSGWITGRNQSDSAIYLFHTGDAGRNWATVELSVPNDLQNFPSESHPPVFFEGLIGFLPVDFFTAEGQGSRVFYYTSDGGATWMPRGRTPGGTVMKFVDASTGWTWAAGQLYFTSDGAQSWEKLPISLPAREQAIDLNFIDPRNGWMITRDTKSRVRLYRSQDGGNTWSVIIP